MLWDCFCINSSLQDQPTFEYDETGKITGYKTKIGGADTVFPFSGGSYKITATVGFLGANPASSGLSGAQLYGKLTFTINNGKVQGATFVKTTHVNTGGDNMYYAYAQSPSVSIEKL